MIEKCIQEYHKVNHGSFESQSSHPQPVDVSVLYLIMTALSQLARNKQKVNILMITFYHTIPTFNDPERDGFENIEGEMLLVITGVSLVCGICTSNTTIISFYHWDISLIMLEGRSPITRRQILDSSKLKEFADDNFKFYENGKKVIQTGRKHCGKRRNCLLKAISPFPTVFSKGLFPRGVKRCHCVGMG